jgi:hypothetical protein
MTGEDALAVVIVLVVLGVGAWVLVRFTPVGLLVAAALSALTLLRGARGAARLYYLLLFLVFVAILAPLGGAFR